MAIHAAASYAASAHRDGCVEAASLAWSYLVEQARAGFPDAAHRMQFPRRCGFLVRQEDHTGDLFARAVVANLLLDSAGQVADDRGAAMRRMAAGEANYLASQKLPRLTGGWRYFPDLADLPPDLDSLAAVMTVFARVAPHYRGLCEQPLSLALSGADGSGAFGTWLIGDTDPWRDRRRMRRAVHRHWGSSPDVDVCAAFCRALRVWDRTRYQRHMNDICAWLCRQQRADGTWPATWYCGTTYGTHLALRALVTTGNNTESQHQGVSALLRLQRADGGWGEGQTAALDTAVAIHSLIGQDRLAHSEAIERGMAVLLDYQAWDGFFKPSSWIRMDTGRATGAGGSVLTHMCRPVTTAFALRTIMAYLH